MNDKWIAQITVLSALSLLPACTRADDIDQDSKNVRQVFEKYLESVKTADLKLASEIWLQSQDIAVVTPFGRFHGWESVRDATTRFRPRGPERPLTAR